MPRQSISELLLKAQQGDPDAQCELGYRYEIAGGVPMDYKQAAEWYRKAAEMGNAEAKYNLGRLYALGTCGIQQDYVEALKWYLKAAEQGYPEASKDLVDLSPFLTQPVKTQNPSKGELSHGVVEKDVHEGVQAGCGAAAGTREFDRRGGAGAGGESQRPAPLAA
jgi:TPR repeat protein